MEDHNVIKKEKPTSINQPKLFQIKSLIDNMLEEQFRWVRTKDITIKSCRYLENFPHIRRVKGEGWRSVCREFENNKRVNEIYLLVNRASHYPIIEG